MKLSAWIVALGLAITTAIFSVCFYLVMSQPIITPTPLPIPKPTDLTCVGTDGHYRPANGRNYVILNDEWCK